MEPNPPNRFACRRLSRRPLTPPESPPSPPPAVMIEDTVVPLHPLNTLHLHHQPHELALPEPDADVHTVRVWLSHLAEHYGISTPPSVLARVTWDGQALHALRYPEVLEALLEWIPACSTVIFPLARNISDDLVVCPSVHSPSLHQILWPAN
jgi:hypothetical protein